MMITHGKTLRARGYNRHIYIPRSSSRFLFWTSLAEIAFVNLEVILHICWILAAFHGFQAFGMCVTSKPGSITTLLTGALAHLTCGQFFHKIPQVKISVEPFNRFGSWYAHLLDIHAEKGSSSHWCWPSWVWCFPHPWPPAAVCALFVLWGRNCFCIRWPFGTSKAGAKTVQVQQGSQCFHRTQNCFNYIASWYFIHILVGYAMVQKKLALGAKYSSIKQLHGGSSIPWGPLVPLSAPGASTPGKFQQCSCSRSPRNKGLITMIGWVHHLAPDDLSLSASDFHEKIPAIQKYHCVNEHWPREKIKVILGINY